MDTTECEPDLCIKVSALYYKFKIGMYKFKMNN